MQYNINIKKQDFNNYYIHYKSFQVIDDKQILNENECKVSPYFF